MNKNKKRFVSLSLYFRDFLIVMVLLILPLLIYTHLKDLISLRVSLYIILISILATLIVIYLFSSYNIVKYHIRDLSFPERYTIKFLKMLFFAVTALIIAFILGLSLYSKEVYRNYVLIYKFHPIFILLYAMLSVLYLVLISTIVYVNRLNKNYLSYDKEMNS